MLRVVGMGELAVSEDAHDVLISYALGSCLGVMAYDPTRCAGGLLHLMLPESSLNRDKARQQPGMFADTGIECLLAGLLALGCSPRRLRIELAGGAEIGMRLARDIARRNVLEARRQLWRFGLSPTAQDTGGSLIRTLRLEIAGGRTIIQGGTPSGPAWR